MSGDRNSEADASDRYKIINLIEIRDLFRARSIEYDGDENADGSPQAALMVGSMKSFGLKKWLTIRNSLKHEELAARAAMSTEHPKPRTFRWLTLESVNSLNYRPIIDARWIMIALKWKLLVFVVNLIIGREIINFHCIEVQHENLNRNCWRDSQVELDGEKNVKQIASPRSSGIVAIPTHLRQCMSVVNR